MAVEEGAGLTAGGQSRLPLDGVRVIDASNLIAGPLTGMLLADYGADVIKIEHPVKGDPLRSHGGSKNGEPLWWKQIARNKRCITVDLGHPDGQDVMRQLAETADVVIESYRPGTFEKWGLDYARLSERNPRLIMLRVSAFGRTGPLCDRPGFGTLAESLSGYAHRNGQPEGPPTLPPFGLGDNVTGLTGAFGVMLALAAREKSGNGQEVDVSITRSLLSMMEPQLLEFDQLGTVMTRTGSRSAMNAPRNLYAASDGRWVAISASTQETADRLLSLVDRDDILAEPWFRTARSRAAHADEIDAAVGAWIGRRTAHDVLGMCAAAGAPACLVYTVEDICQDPQYCATEAIATVEDPVLGPLRMPNVPVVLTSTPGRVDWSGRRLGADTDEVLSEIGLGERLAQLRAAGVIA